MDGSSKHNDSPTCYQPQDGEKGGTEVNLGLLTWYQLIYLETIVFGERLQ